MFELLPFCMKNDKNAPNFMQLLIDEGKIRSYCKMEPGDMDQEERKFLKDKTLKYYRRECINVLLQMIPLKKP